MLSAFILSMGSYSAMLLAKQLIYRCHVHPGPLVLRTSPFKFPTPTTDRDQTVSRRFEPSSRTTLIGEQPNPSCYPQGSFYPLSDDLSTQNRRITMPYFRTCSTCLSRSQAPLCHYTRNTISNRIEDTLGHLRYTLGGDRPSQTAYLTLSCKE